MVSKIDISWRAIIYKTNLKELRQYEDNELLFKLIAIQFSHLIVSFYQIRASLQTYSFKTRYWSLNSRQYYWNVQPKLKHFQRIFESI